MGVVTQLVFGVYVGIWSEKATVGDGRSSVLRLDEEAYLGSWEEDELKSEEEED